MAENGAHITVRDLTMAFGRFVLMHDLDFTVRRNDIFIIMGASGCGKSTLLRHMVGLNEPAHGEVFYGGMSFTRAEPVERKRMLRGVGILYQGGALFSSMTLAENVGMPLAEYTGLGPAEVLEIASLKLALVGLKRFEDFYPSQLSGGMVKRAGLARAMALDPEILVFDEPSAGLDPISSRLLDDLILELRDSLGATIVIVTHELAIRINLGEYRTQDARIPVFVDIDDARATQEGAENSADYVHTLIHDRGLRAQLQPQSLLTGLLFVQLDFFPNTPIVTVLPSDSPYREIPTVPTTLAEVQQTITRILAKLDNADVEGTLATAREALEGIRSVVTSPDLRRFGAALPGALANVDRAVTSFRQLATNLDGETGPLIAGLRQAATQADETLREWKGAATLLNGPLEPDSVLRNQLTTALDELTGAARSVRLLADFLERNPSAVLRGRPVNSR